MKPIVTNAIAAAGLAALVIAIHIGGHSLGDPATSASVEVDDIDASDVEGLDFDAGNQTETAIEQAPALDANGLERTEPRAPLSELSLALPPKPKTPGEWKGTPLNRAVAPSAGVIEAQGYKVAVAGIEPVQADETCNSGGKTWTCGIYARTAFRAFLRGRAPNCVVPPEPDREMITAECRMGDQDIAEWLVQNGWARAAAGSKYAEAGKAAEDGKRGIFGPEPSRDLGGLTGSINEPAPPAGPSQSFEILVPDAPASDPTTPTDPPAPVQ